MGRRVSLAELAGDEDVAPHPGLRGALAAAELGPSRTVPIHTVAPNPLNKRPPGADEEIGALAETIREHGVLQPLVVCSVAAFSAAFPAVGLAAAAWNASAGRAAADAVKWVALVGNRRLQAAGLAGRTTVDVVVNDERVASMWEVMLVENGARRDLPPWLEAEAIAEALRTSGISQRALARRIGRSPMYVTQRLALLKLIPPLREMLEAGALTVEQARKLGELPPEEQQRAVPGSGGVHGVYTTKRAGRTFRVGTTPAAAAEAIRARFGPGELAELIDLLRREEPTGGP